ncbi:MAG: GAF domain-containing protein [Microscillaceae bacterium]|nr:GAF domain-containing protein [Microscillaceae bacterium]
MSEPQVSFKMAAGPVGLWQRSLQSWIALHIGALILIILLFLVYIFNRVSYYTQAYQSLGREVELIESLNQKLFGQLEQSNQMVYHQLINKTSDQNAARRRLWEQKIQPTLDSIQVLSALWLSAELKLKLADLDLNLKKLRKDQDVIERLVGEEIENRYFLEGDGTTPSASASVSSITVYNRNLIDLLNLIHKQFQEFRYLRQREYLQRGAELAKRTEGFWLYTGVLGFALLGLTFYTGLSIRQKIGQGLQTVQAQTRQLRLGQIPEPPLRSELEIMPILEDLQQIGFNLSQIQQIGKNVREGQLDRKIEVFSSESELGQTLSAMQEDLKNVGQRDFQRNWVNEGLTLFGNLLREYNDTQSLYDQLNASLVRYLKANQGGIFILDEKNERKPLLELKSVYAFERTRYHEKSISPGQGLVGQAWKEKEVIYIEETDANFVQISSGLGGAQPRSILIVPMVNNEAKVLGVLEIASFQRFAEYEIDFARRVAEMIVSAISAIKNNEKPGFCSPRHNTSPSKCASRKRKCAKTCSN